ncbi:hypothetical protein AYO21_07173 [Fonsecaea monophora]|uniref:CHK kinase-like domain-containing protein n=1 Tax=Fonsecaea monophora TaxID=254056 RepID=A0A177F2V8_9EURO|nr:hypothetical protein AYO21_07173 [Fonsecaea monophora]KAH0835257.1 aminoglycoside phosphotransferase [Fonsecaea pedrosoi]OAG38667.1 hypothetical protein AYO21_07173 [Fonsecaea monophora]
MGSQDINFVHTVGDVTAEFLSSVLNTDIAEVSSQRIGTGLIGECHRFRLQYALGASEGPSSVMLKTAAADVDSRSTGKSLKLYQREALFYSEVAPTLAIPCLAKCYHSAANVEQDAFDLVLEDIHPAEPGNDLTGASLEQAHVALVELARLQIASVKSKNTLPEWLHEDPAASQSLCETMWKRFAERYQDKLKPQHHRVCERFVACFDNYSQSFRAPETAKCLVHGDYRLDNMLFGGDSGRGFVVVDWQTMSWGPMFQDVAYFLGCCVEPEIRRAHSNELLRAYYDALGANATFTFDQCQEGVRRQSFLGLGRAFIAPMILERTECGDDLFLTLLDRLVNLILDLDALETLPAPSTPTPLRPDPQDEQRHPSGEDSLHNESWYFDVADPEQATGVWIRLGVLPHQPGSWYAALICGPGQPTIAVVDFNVKTVTEDLTIDTPHIKASHTAVSPLKQYRVTLTGLGEAFDDPADLLRRPHVRGRQVPVDLDLTWHTVSTPYKWRMLARYEISCTVSGTVKIGGRTISTFNHAYGQRDHSWGPRDWWAADWVWTAFHLEDGTHLHGVEIRMPKMPKMAAGYRQDKDSTIVELSGVVATEEVDEETHLIRSATISYSCAGKEDIVLDFEPAGNAPLLLESTKDGRFSYFPRCWAKVQARDGRKGVGWVEWNNVQHQ